MYHLLTGLYNQLSQKPQYNVLLLGTSASGKTAWLDKVRGQVTKSGTRNLSRIAPTVGQNVVDLKLAAATLHFWDLGGDASLRRMWDRYFDDAEALVWAMDARDWAAAADVPALTDEEREQEQDDQAAHNVDAEANATRRRNESWGVLAELREKRHLAELPLLLIMTHIDRLSERQATHFRRAVSDVMTRKLGELGAGPASDGGRPSWTDWHVVVCSAKTGEGCSEFVDWLHVRARKKQQQQPTQG